MLQIRSTSTGKRPEMKAVRFHEYGDADVLRYEDVEVPTPGAGEVLVRVAASAFNPVDANIRAGFMQGPLPVTLPHTPNYDVAGTVEALGEGVDGVDVGDAVVAFLPMTADGAAAEYVVAPAEALTAAPTSIALEDAAALPSVALTAQQALFELGELQAGQRVLVNGAGGSVGAYAVQLAKQAGAHVVATVSPRSREQITTAGADQIIDYTTTDVTAAVTEPVDVLLNLAPIAPEQFVALVALVRDGGHVVSTTAWMETPADEARNVAAATVFVRSDAAQLAQLVALVDRGELRVDIGERVPLAQLPEVHARASAGELRGKVIVLPAGA
jgi:NADPH:quinone reductase-like Zn-dependent oxidoreductase